MVEVEIMALCMVVWFLLGWLILLLLYIYRYPIRVKFHLIGTTLSRFPRIPQTFREEHVQPGYSSNA